ncbi:hypothetical protein EI94DRAFT_1831390 [Lactarius quietus]|nr:hypothetical protein EI94DRAFT_1831390 [Lactarius quietus]
MSSYCKECGRPTQVSRDIGSASALTSAYDFLPDSYTHDLSTSTRSTTLESIRRSAAWELPDQASDSRHERNKFVLHESIQTLADRLGHRGAAVRAISIFDTAMQCPTVRWGRAAKLAAGAALVFAIREHDKGDHTHRIAVSFSLSLRLCASDYKDTPPSLFGTWSFCLCRAVHLASIFTVVVLLDNIETFRRNVSLPPIHFYSERVVTAYNSSLTTLFLLQCLLSEPVVELKRAQLRLLPVLTLDVPRNRATSHLLYLAVHLRALVSASDVLRTASVLYDLPNLERATFNAGSAGAGGCALLLLALEARARPPRLIPHVLVLASRLGAALGARGVTVMARYRVLVNTIDASAARVPWLAIANTPGSKQRTTTMTGKKA